MALEWSGHKVAIESPEHALFQCKSLPLLLLARREVMMSRLVHRFGKVRVERSTSLQQLRWSMEDEVAQIATLAHFAWDVTTHYEGHAIYYTEGWEDDREAPQQTESLGEEEEDLLDEEDDEEDDGDSATGGREEEAEEDI